MGNIPKDYWSPEQAQEQNLEEMSEEKLIELEEDHQRVNPRAIGKETLAPTPYQPRRPPRRGAAASYSSDVLQRYYGPIGEVA